MNSTLTIIAIIGTLISTIGGVKKGNKELFEKFNQGFSGIFLFWMVLKNSVIHLIVFALVLAGLSAVLDEIWLYLTLLIYMPISFFTIKKKLIDEFDILLKPGSGLLTPEGRAQMQSNNITTSNSIPNQKTSNNASTLIYSDTFGGRVIGRVDNDGSIYDSEWGGSYIGHFEDNNIYEGAFTGKVISRYNEDGIIYEGAISYEKLGEVSRDGVIYDNGLFGKGKPIARIEGTNKFVAAAAYFGLLR